ncbi:hypothetical protein T02_121 [Trichinella nativa]|uniref:Uncharacterized protein n=1 Tax=Trichinella nativa TaxID=6335 RepID=A0A0V1LP72_9BILA|nr:hypothetical protein T02_121 [Trichinella nativa]
MNCKANKIISRDIKHKCLNMILHIILSIFTETDVFTFMEKFLTIILFLDFGLANSYNLKKIPFSLITSIPNRNAGKRKNFNMKRTAISVSKLTR